MRLKHLVCKKSKSLKRERVVNKRFSLICKLFTFSVVIFFVFQAVRPFPLGSIKGTYEPLKAEFKRCSPLHGTIWWESGLVEKYYHFGYFDDKTKGKEFRDGSLFLKGDGVPRLIHNLFHVVQGSFNRTYNNSYPANHFSPALIGKLVRKIEGFIQEKKQELGDEEREELKRLIEQDEDFQSGLAGVKKTHDELVPKVKEAERNFKNAEKNLKKARRVLGDKIRKWIVAKFTYYQQLLLKT